MTIKIKSNAMDFVKLLKKRHGALAIVGSDTVNTAAKVVERAYQKKLDQFILRNKFTKGATAILKSKPTGSKGDFRPIKNINAIVGVRKMKGGKDHYLLKQEVGDTVSGTGKTAGFVAVPTDPARTGKRLTRPVKKALRLQSNPKANILKAGGDVIGVPGSRFSNRQSWAILAKYTGASRNSKNRAGNKYGWNTRKPFFFTGLKSGLKAMGVFIQEGKKFSMKRALTGKSRKIKALHKFEKAITKLSPRMMEAIFKRSASKFIRGK